MIINNNGYIFNSVRQFSFQLLGSRHHSTNHNRDLVSSSGRRVAISIRASSRLKDRLITSKGRATISSSSKDPRVSSSRAFRKHLLLNSSSSRQTTTLPFPDRRQGRKTKISTSKIKHRQAHRVIKLRNLEV